MAGRLDGIVMAWEKEPLYNRLEQCRFMLKVHGYLTDGESWKVEQRLKKESQKQGYNLKEVKLDG